MNAIDHLGSANVAVGNDSAYQNTTEEQLFQGLMLLEYSINGNTVIAALEEVYFSDGTSGTPGQIRRVGYNI